MRHRQSGPAAPPARFTGTVHGVPGTGSVSRRTFLIGASSALALTACGGSSSKGSSPGTSASGGSGPGTDAETPGTSSGGAIVLIARFATGTLTTGTQRAPFVLGDVNGLLPLEQTPATLTAKVLDATGATVVPSLTVERHGAALQQPYYPFQLSLQTPGAYELRLASSDATGAIQVSKPADVPIPQVGAALPPEDTPTTAAARGVNPICTRQPACSLHKVTLRQALSTGKPVAYLIGTPAYCQTGICGPVLDLLLAESKLRPNFSMVHAEVYTDDTINTPSPAVTNYHMSFEPCLFVANAKGVMTARLDSIWDAGELSKALDTAL
jgi:hypothetical protein